MYNRNQKRYRNKEITNKVIVDGNFEKALRIFKKKVRRAGIIEEVKRRAYYTKPSEARQIAKKKAIKREEKRRLKAEIV